MRKSLPSGERLMISRIVRVSGFAVLLGILLLATSALSQHSDNKIVRENRLPGTTVTQSTQAAPLVSPSAADDQRLAMSTASDADSGGPANAPHLAWTDSNAIEGYSDKITLNHGESVGFYVRSNEPWYDITILRVGWYSGVGKPVAATADRLAAQHYPLPA